jgi:phage FluMu protein Com
MPDVTEPATDLMAMQPNEWDVFRCRRCHKLLFKATHALLTGLHRSQQIEIKCACKTMNYLMGA